MTLCGFAVPSYLVSTFCTPAAVMTARTVLPAMTPVPSGAGFSMHLTGAEVAQHLVRNRGLGQVDLVQVLLGRLDALADGLGNFLGLAGAVADDAFGGVADDDQRGEGHVLTALDDLGDAVDRNDLVLEVEAVRVDLFLHCHNVLSSFLAANEGALRKLRNRVRLRGLHRREP